MSTNHNKPFRKSNRVYVVICWVCSLVCLVGLSWSIVHLEVPKEQRALSSPACSHSQRVGTKAPSDSVSFVRAGRQKDQAVEGIQSGYKKHDLHVLEPIESDE